MKQYPKYKDSGVSWIGEIPEGWKCTQIRRYLSCVCTGATPPGAAEKYYSNIGTPWFTPGDFKDFNVLKDSSKYLSEEGNDIMKKYPANTILMIGIGGTMGKVALSPMECSFNQQINALLTKGEIDNKFVVYYLKIERDNIFNTAKFTTLPILNQSETKRIPIVVPSLSEQHAVVSYLDKKTAQIDRFISEAEREIEKLNELKQAQIAHLVTHGTNPDAPMKDSGIAWIGQIPEHWEVNKIRSHFKERRTKVSDKDYPALSVAREGIVPQLDTAVKTDNGDNRKLVLKNDFVVNSRSDRKGSCGVSDYDGSVSLISIVLEPHDINPQYVHYLFRSNNYVEEFYRNGRGIVADLWTTRYSEMRNIFIPIPPVSEQKDIVSAINSLNNKIETLTSELTTQIDHLKELKQRIISDVVTGKIDVREVNN
ncbi:restriction endonuclease subunit S [Segatella oris]|jgi:restriction modification system DNA specificity subunit|uniref:restriction endonuclease subunit S n=1 Tax=Segatella oris TaxID=28135 RepID=UPI00241F0F2C|nr:restriction endonuclease subunit S [Segatella oris]